MKLFLKYSSLCDHDHEPQRHRETGGWMTYRGNNVLCVVLHGKN